MGEGEGERFGEGATRMGSFSLGTGPGLLVLSELSNVSITLRSAFVTGEGCLCGDIEFTLAGLKKLKTHTKKN